jgi:hypothetical protein
MFVEDPRLLTNQSTTSGPLFDCNVCSGPYAFSFPVSVWLYILSMSSRQPDVCRGCVELLRSLSFLITGQCTVVHSLHVFETVLIDVEKPKVVGGVERGCVLSSPCLLLSGQCTVVHSLHIFETA